MRRFYLKTTAFILLALLTIVVCGIRIGDNDPSDYLASIIDKHARLKSISSSDDRVSTQDARLQHVIACRSWFGIYFE